VSRVSTTEVVAKEEMSPGPLAGNGPAAVPGGHIDAGQVGQRRQAIVAPTNRPAARPGGPAATGSASPTTIASRKGATGSGGREGDAPAQEEGIALLTLAGEQGQAGLADERNSEER